MLLIFLPEMPSKYYVFNKYLKINSQKILDSIGFQQKLQLCYYAGTDKIYFGQSVGKY